MLTRWSPVLFLLHLHNHSFCGVCVLVGAKTPSPACVWGGGNVCVWGGRVCVYVCIQGVWVGGGCVCMCTSVCTCVHLLSLVLHPLRFTSFPPYSPLP